MFPFSNKMKTAPDNAEVTPQPSALRVRNANGTTATPIDAGRNRMEIYGVASS